jgi:hypothetical protein
MTLPRSAPALLALLSAAAMALVACGSKGNGSGPGPEDSGPGEDATQDGGEEGSTSGTYPAFPVDYPQMSKNQSAVLSAPVIVTVSWPGDTNASTWEAFGDGIGASSYWSATTAQYGVGAATSGSSNHVRMTQPLASLSYYAMQDFVIAAVQAAESGSVPDAGAPDAGSPNPLWPTPTKDAHGNVQTIYSLFIPSSTTVTDPGSGQSFCDEGGLGYHDDVVVNGVPVPYAVNLECPSEPLSGIEETAAHETIEASTDPYSESTDLGYVNFDTDHIAWDLYTGLLGADELADACQNWQDSYVQETGSFPYWVQRSWSNESALAGHAPCAPAPATPYQGMTLFPSQESTVKLDLSSIGAGTVSTRGFSAALGQPLTFQAGFFSDASTGPWTITYDFPADTQLFSNSGAPIGNGKATVALDTKSGQNGDKVNVTVTVTAKGTAGFHVMAITWDPPTTTSFLPHYLPLVIVDQ